jgi:hypothetical protein
MITKRSREGELYIDHRASPGLPPDFYRRIGLVAPEAPGGAVVERATVTCCHCNAVVVLNPLRTRARGHCFKCDAYVCDNPACHRDCTPFDKTLDDAEKRAYREQQQQMLTGFILQKGLSNG